jgi:hypothetical protein
MVAGQTYTLNFDIFNSESARSPSLEGSDSAERLSSAEMALYRRSILYDKYPAKSGTRNGLQTAIAAMESLVAKHPSSVELNVGLAFLHLTHPESSADRSRWLEVHHDHPNSPLAVFLLHDFAAKTRILFGVEGGSKTNGSLRDAVRLKFDNGAEFLLLGDDRGVVASQRAKITFSVPKSRVPWTFQYFEPVDLGFTVGAAQASDRSWVIPDAKLNSQDSFSDSYLFKVRNPFANIVTGLVALLAMPLLLAGVALAFRKSSSIHPFALLRQGRIANWVGMARRNPAKIVYLAVAAIYMGPWPGSLFNALTHGEAHFSLHNLADSLFMGGLTRDVYRALLESIFGIVEGFTFGTTYHSFQPFDDTHETLAFSVLFVLLLLAYLFSLKTVKSRVAGFLVNTVIPAIAVGYCAKDIYLFLLNLAAAYIHPRDLGGGISGRCSYWPLVPAGWLLSSSLVWFVSSSISTVSFTRLGPQRTLHCAGWAIALASISVLCLVSGGYGVRPDYGGNLYYSPGNAVVILPIYILLAAGLIAFSGYSSQPMEHRHETGSARSAADAVQNLALFAVPFCAFAILQMSHSESLALNLVKLRKDFTEATLNIRMRRPTPPDAYLETDPGSGFYGKYFVRNFGPQDSAYDKNPELPPRPLGFFRPAGMKGMIRVTKVERKNSEGMYHVTSDEDAGPIWSETRYVPGAGQTRDSNDKSVSNPLKPAGVDELAKINKEEEELESRFQKAELKITQEKTSIPGTPIELTGQYVSWCIVMITIAVLFMIHDRITLCEKSPLDGSGAYLIWGNTVVTKTFALIWPIVIAIAILFQTAGLVAITMLQASELPEPAGITFQSVLCFVLLVALAVSTPIITLSIVRSCSRIRRAICESTLVAKPDAVAADPIAPQ